MAGDGGDHPLRDADGFNGTNVRCEPLRRKGASCSRVSLVMGGQGRGRGEPARSEGSRIGNGDSRQEVEVTGQLGGLLQSRCDEGKGQEKGQEEVHMKPSAFLRVDGGQGAQGGLQGGWLWGSCFQEKPKHGDQGWKRRRTSISSNLGHKGVELRGGKGWSSEVEKGGAQRWKGVELEADWGVASKRGSATKAVTVVHVPEGLRSFIQRSLGICSE